MRRPLAHVLRALLLACLPVTGHAASPPSLPRQLTLTYTLHYGNVIVGSVVKTLLRGPHGHYFHSTWTRPDGIAKIFTDVNFVEQGQFVLHGTTILPQVFADTKTGDGHDYQRKVQFDYRHHRLIFRSAPPAPLPRGTQDLDSVFYQFMLEPVEPAMNRVVPVTNGKELNFYHFVYRNSESLPTPWGHLATYQVARLSASQWAQVSACPNVHDRCGDALRDFDIWVAPSLGGIAVKLEQTDKGHTLTLTLDHIERQ